MGKLKLGKFRYPAEVSSVTVLNTNTVVHIGVFTSMLPVEILAACKQSRTE